MQPSYGGRAVARREGILARVAFVATLLATTAWAGPAAAACLCGDAVCDSNCGETSVSCAQDCNPTACASNPPAGSKPYFMIIADTSGTMSTAVATSNSCGYENTRIGHLRCALKNTINSFKTSVNFGLSSFAWTLSSCPGSLCGTCVGAACFPGCSFNYAATDDNFCGPLKTDANTNTALNDSYPGTHTLHAGGLVVVPLLQDDYWTSPENPSNVSTLLSYVDNNCTSGVELGSNSNSPLGGSLFVMNQYFSNTYTSPFTAAAVPTPLGTLAQGERACRSLNVILITDGDETCDSYNGSVYTHGEGLAVFEAGRLLSPGVTFGSNTFSIKTYVIGLPGSTSAALNNIASAGGTSTAQSATNAAEITSALSTILNGAVKTESCDSQDNDCNGCVDEGLCAAPDQCHTAGTCNPAGGACSYPNKTEGTPCDDGTACTQPDTCVNGTCTGANPVVCTAQDQCHVAGTCDPVSGSCSNPNAAEGTSCSDGVTCTGSDTCTDGGCSGPPLICSALDECHEVGSCAEDAGCANPPKANGSPCSIGTCQDAVCVAAEGDASVANDSGTTGDSGTSGGRDSGTSGPDAGYGADASSIDGSTGDGADGDSAGCGCRITRASDAPAPMLLAFGGFGWLATRRRRRARRRNA